MPRNHQGGVELSTKRQKVDSKGGYRYTNAEEIRKSLRTQDQESLAQGTPTCDYHLMICY